MIVESHKRFLVSDGVVCFVGFQNRQVVWQDRGAAINVFVVEQTGSKPCRWSCSRSHYRVAGRLTKGRELTYY